MSRYRREAELQALYGDKYPAVVVSQMGARKRDRKKLLSDQLQEQFRPEPTEEPIEGSYASGTFSSPLAWQQAARSGAQSRLFDPELSMISPALRGMTSYGSLGGMFKGSSAGPGGNPFSTAGTTMATAAPVMASAPGAGYGAMRQMPAPPPAGTGPDFYGLRTPGMGETRAYTPQARSSWTPPPPLASQPLAYNPAREAAMGRGPANWQQVPMTPERVGNLQGLRERYGSGYGYQGPRTGAGFNPMNAAYPPVQWRGPDVIPEGDYGSLEEALAAGRRGYAEGTLPSYAGGTLRGLLERGPAEWATGMSIEDLTEAARRGEGVAGTMGPDLDKRQHAYGMQKAAERWGAIPALAGGAVWEALTGPLGEEGFSPRDLEANLRGVEMSARSGQLPLQRLSRRAVELSAPLIEQMLRPSKPTTGLR